MAPVRFGYGLGWNGSSGSGFRLRRLFWRREFLCFPVQLNRERQFRFRFLKTVPAVPVLRSVPGENGSDGSGFLFRLGSWATLKELFWHNYLYKNYKISVQSKFLPMFFLQTGTNQWHQAISQRKCSGGTIFVIFTKNITKRKCSKELFL